MNDYILILTIVVFGQGSGTAIESIEMPSMEACEAAGEKWLKYSEYHTHENESVRHHHGRRDYVCASRVVTK